MLTIIFWSFRVRFEKFSEMKVFTMTDSTSVIKSPWSPFPIDIQTATETEKIFLEPPNTWIFQVCKICAKNHPRNLPKGRIFTYLEDPGIPKTPDRGGIWKSIRLGSCSTQTPQLIRSQRCFFFGEFSASSSCEPKSHLHAS